VNNPTRLADEQPGGFEAALIRAARREGPSPDVRRLAAAAGGVASAMALVPKASAAGTVWKGIAMMAAKGFVAGAVVTTALVGIPHLLAPQAAQGRAAPGVPAAEHRAATGVAAQSGQSSPLPASPPAFAKPVSAAPSEAAATPSSDALSGAGKRTRASQQSPSQPQTDTSSAAPSAPPAADPLGDEIRAFERARRALASGDVATAGVELDRYERSFRNGALSLEAEVLHIEILEASGNGAAARARARSFLETHPAAPAARRLRSLLARSGSAVK
jgi:hypothetical protein